MNLDFELIKNMLSELPVNLFFKDTQCRYIFASHYWRHLNRSDDESWTIYGKTDLEVRKNQANAIIAYNEDKKILETGKGTSYVIEECIDGITEYLNILKRPVRDKNGEIIGIVGLINDITDHVKYLQNLDHYASIDSVTGLYSKKGFVENIYKTINLHKSANQHTLMVMLGYVLPEDYRDKFNAMLYLASALRLPLVQERLSARIDNNIYAVLIPCDKNKNMDNTIEEFISGIENSRRLYSENNPSFSHPKLSVTWQLLENDDIDDCISVFDNLKQQLENLINPNDNIKQLHKEEFISLRNQITDNPENDWSVTKIAEQMGMSKSHFHRTYKKIFSTSCTDDIIEARLNKSRNLLQYTDLSVSEIALRCGYKNESHFMRQFHEKIGITALQYRKKLKNPFN